NGSGIPTEARERIFDPFFTTKAAGEGTGLGLSLCYDIVVQANQGSLDVETELGEYTELRVRLPKRNP
ncbi:MAG: ATP-binding protein, partial [Acidobacteriota bacterium]